MSGAGKTVAMQSLEDLGYFCVDNLPPSLLPKFWELMKESGKMNKIALVMDLRGRDFFDSIDTALDELDNTSFITTKILFLEQMIKFLFRDIRNRAAIIHLNQTDRCLKELKRSVNC